MHGITRNYSLVANEKKESSHRDAHLLWHIVNIYLIASARFFAMYPSSLAWSYITTVLSWHSPHRASETITALPRDSLHKARSANGCISVCFGYTSESAAESHVSPTAWKGKHEEPLRNVQAWRACVQCSGVTACSSTIYCFTDPLIVFYGSLSLCLVSGCEGILAKTTDFFFFADP